MAIIRVEDGVAPPSQPGSSSAVLDIQGKVRGLPFVVRELMAGGIAGGTAKTCVAPLERCKILFQTGQMRGLGIGQTLSNVFQNEGVRGLWKGNGASVLRIVPYAAVHFGAYEHFRVMIGDAAGVPRGNVPPSVDLLAGSCAGAAAVLLTYPLDLVRTRLAYRTESRAAHGPKRETIRSILQATYRQEGLLGLYRGVGPTLVGILPYAGLKFYVYQSLKRGYNTWLKGEEGKEGRRLPVPVMLSFGACSGVVAQTVTYPLDVVRRQMQVQGRHEEASHGSPPPPTSGTATPPSASSATSSSASASAPSQGHKSSSRGSTYVGEDPHVAGSTGRTPSSGMSNHSAVPEAFRGGSGTSSTSSTASTSGTGVHGRVLHDRPLGQLLHNPIAGGGTSGTGGKWSLGQGSVQRGEVPREHLRSTVHGLITIVRTQGWKALYSGLSINYLKVVPSTAIGFAIYDALKQYLDLPQNL